MTTAPTKREIVIKLHPFQSSACHKLITALDDEVEIMYPDAADFPYEGPGSWLFGVPSTYPVPDQPGSNGAASTEASTGEATSNTNQNAHDVVWQNEDPDEMQHAEEKGELFFFVAFPKRSDGESNGAKEDAEDEAIGCVGVRTLPYFPFHRAPERKDVNGVASAQSVIPTEPVTAEVKRMYVIPSWRGCHAISSSSSTSSSTSTGQGKSVAALLLEHTEAFAREQMNVKRLVLETGARQFAAMKVYSRAGWTRCKEFGDYIGAGEDVGGLSRCWEKTL